MGPPLERNTHLLKPLTGQGGSMQGLAINEPKTAVTLRVNNNDLLLERALRWERERANATYLVQPTDGGAVRSLTWAEAMGEARKMAAHLKSRNFPPGSRIAIIAKNSAHFIITDLAIWMAGHVS